MLLQMEQNLKLYINSIKENNRMKKNYTWPDWQLLSKKKFYIYAYIHAYILMYKTNVFIWNLGENLSLSLLDWPRGATNHSKSHDL